MFELTYFVHLCLRYLHIDDSECFRIPRVPREQPWNKFWDNLCFWQQWSHHPLLTNTRDRRKNHQVACTRYFAPELDAPITRDGLFMVDSGGQYLDGTTDVTRTFHYGTPTEEMIERYTDVLQVLFASFYQKHQ